MYIYWSYSRIIRFSTDGGNYATEYIDKTTLIHFPQNIQIRQHCVMFHRIYRQDNIRFSSHRIYRQDNIVSCSTEYIDRTLFDSAPTEYIDKTTLIRFPQNIQIGQHFVMFHRIYRQDIIRISSHRIYRQDNIVSFSTEYIDRPTLWHVPQNIKIGQHSIQLPQNIQIGKLFIQFRWR